MQILKRREDLSTVLFEDGPFGWMQIRNVLLERVRRSLGDKHNLLLLHIGPHIVDGHDVRMGQGLQQLRLLRDAGAILGAHLAQIHHVPRDLLA